MVSMRLIYGWPWLAAPLSLFALSLVLGWFDRSTEIIPTHEAVLTLCFMLGGLGALTLASVAIFGRQSMKMWQRAYLAVPLAALGFLSVFLLSNRIAELAENHLDFPSSTTRTFSGFLRIERAYRTHGKGQSWNIQTTPTWSNLDITPDDYQFMLDHRRPEDLGSDANEISSKGYFCAHVVMQQSRSALRVLNAGSHKLPVGTVVVCPASSGSPAQ